MEITTTKTRQGLLSFIAIIFLIPTLCATNASAHPGTPIEQGFNDMYNLDFTAADHQFDVWEAAHPDDPMGPSATPPRCSSRNSTGWAFSSLSSSPTTTDSMIVAS